MCVAAAQWAIRQSQLWANQRRMNLDALSIYIKQLDNEFMAYTWCLKSYSRSDDSITFT